MSDAETTAADQDQDTAQKDADQEHDSGEEQGSAKQQDSAEERDAGQEQESDGDQDGDQDGEQDGPNAQVVEVAPDPERTGMHIEKPERADALSAEELEEIRQERLDPENRPDNVEVDNTQRDFDTNTGKFTDSDMEEEVGPFDDDAV